MIWLILFILVIIMIACLSGSSQEKKAARANAGAFVATIVGIVALLVLFAAAASAATFGLSFGSSTFKPELDSNIQTSNKSKNSSIALTIGSNPTENNRVSYFVRVGILSNNGIENAKPIATSYYGIYTGINSGGSGACIGTLPGDKYYGKVTDDTWGGGYRYSPIS